jgi:hypothetical protein
LTDVLKSYTYMSDGPREPRRDGAAPQPGAELAAAVGQLRSGGPQFGRIMRRLSSTGLSISSPGRAAQGASASAHRENPFHCQASGKSRQAPPSIRQAKPLHVERGGQPGCDRVAGSRARAWLRDGTLHDKISDTNIAWIGYWLKSWYKRMTFSYQTSSGRWGSPMNLRACQEITRTS